MDNLQSRLDSLAERLEGDLKYDALTRVIYSTDASVYREQPLAVVWPKGSDDIRKVLEFSRQNKTGITMRAGGTSLAGQVVSAGIIVDVSRYMNRILELNTAERWVFVEPGVVLDELNMKLREHGLFFGPETSTSNRCNIGGMVGNNACGSHSILYGSTRDHTLGISAILSDGSEAWFGALDGSRFDEKCRLQTLEGSIYRFTAGILRSEENLERIRKEYPDSSIHRRNTGYALDVLADCELFTPGSDKPFNMAVLLAGSEGTLAVSTGIRLNLVALPPASKALVCVHLRERNEAFRANLVALRHKPGAVEMMDNRILELTEDNLSQRDNRFFLEGKPGAILIVEFARDTPDDIDRAAGELIDDLKREGFGYAYPVIRGKDISKVWELRKAGLGILANMKGDAKPVAVIEDTAVAPALLPAYMEDIEKMLARHGREAVFHAHIGSGELHLRPILNLKDPHDSALFRQIGLDTAHIVKKYRGSLSGEHGDGRLRGEFIPVMLGKEIYELLRQLKQTWDPYGILNPGKITETPAMNSSLRYIPGEPAREPQTYYDFSSTGGIIRAAEKCNGSADCRKSARIGGVMCPSFMATGDEDKTTRARANVLRELMNGKGDPWDHPEIHDILDLCLGCKGCKSECPSGVDIAKIKSEYLQHWHERHGIPLRTFLTGHIATINRLASKVPGLFNYAVKSSLTKPLITLVTGFSPKRSIPLISRTTLSKWLKKNLETLNPQHPLAEVCLFVDEFTEYNDTHAGIAAVRLLTALNYKVITVSHGVSARTFISKGMLKNAVKEIRKNIIALGELADKGIPVIGIEPSAILGFRDEYPELAGSDLRDTALRLASSSLMFDEFIVKEYRAGHIDRDRFTKSPAAVLLHAHCQQKAVASSASTLAMLSIPSNYSVREIPSGCCGMAGAFGYEKEHYELSMKVGELVLFPEVRNSSDNTIIAAPGTSCRHHIMDGTGRVALHPAEVLWMAMKE